MHQLAKIPTKSKKGRQNPLPPPFDSDIDQVMDDERDDIAHEFFPPHEGPLADTRLPSPDSEVHPSVDNEAEDNDDQPSSQNRYSEAYPHLAGQPIRKEKTDFEKFRDNDSAVGKQPWDPFSSQKEWELATWLMKNVNQRATEEYLNLPIVSI
jgi:hypothetical protein